ncbi:hypothetical protein HDU81_005645 [Chytriomyces hyalinus]|nr:hypothetical protein HDU81_005645 [Chytriomyces hyalinus]
MGQAGLVGPDYVWIAYNRPTVPDDENDYQSLKGLIKAEDALTGSDSRIEEIHEKIMKTAEAEIGKLTILMTANYSGLSMDPVIIDEFGDESRFDHIADIFLSKMEYYNESGPIFYNDLAIPPLAGGDVTVLSYESEVPSLPKGAFTKMSALSKKFNFKSAF